MASDSEQMDHIADLRVAKQIRRFASISATQRSPCLVMIFSAPAFTSSANSEKLAQASGTRDDVACGNSHVRLGYRTICATSCTS